MLLAERQQKLVKLVNDKKSVRVSELSEMFSVSEETIRRDLEKLEYDKKLIRSHGGAIHLTPDDDSIEIPFSERETMNVEEKQEIALKAVEYVKEGDKIILDASTTACYMAKVLPDIAITVLTNSVKVAMVLAKKERVTVISTGGILLSNSLSYVGLLAESAMDTYHVDKAFVSCKGLHLERGLTDSDEQQARIKKKMIENAGTVYIMIDCSKIGVRSFSKFSDLDVIDYLITDSNIDGTLVQQINDRGLDVIKV
ncbi:DeoR family transcriptional regulator [Salipaludibacillus neizhouensis]|uniref:DeoR family transcriptional regulator n=1 Tax=Salipaludibacillus neizhouensis TaxID=885475 RepID=A0A3A9K2H0_9BACI|nr:DeoR/GlpR family DNA-binding transcription regulator [Salipaludibacillus neizhouensis]RKL65408.1 DeoR family transcriptional regulator [Salipaludibacillus neizhouensis]